MPCKVGKQALIKPPFLCNYKGADKSLARPGRKQATFPAFYGTWGVHYHIHKSPSHVPTLAK